MDNGWAKSAGLHNKQGGTRGQDTQQNMAPPPCLHTLLHLPTIDRSNAVNEIEETQNYNPSIRQRSHQGNVCRYKKQIPSVNIHCRSETLALGNYNMLRPLETLSELSPKNGGPMYLNDRQPKKNSVQVQVSKTNM